jgi:hypothetical protein
MMIIRKDNGYNGLGSLPLSAKYPVIPMTIKPKTEIGRFKSWAWAMVLYMALANVNSLLRIE